MYNKIATIIIGLMLIVNSGIAQVDTTYTGPMAKTPDTCLSIETIISTATQIRKLQQRSITQSKIIEAYEDQIDNLETLNSQNETIIKLKNKELEIYGNITEKFIDVTKDKTPWYKSSEFNFISGFVIGGTLIYMGARAGK